MKLFFYCIVFLLTCCQRNSLKKTAIQGDHVLKGNIVNDTIFNDTILTYDFQGRLLNRKVYKNSELEGTSVDYYLDGKPMSVMTYSHGLKNGPNAFYDTTGRMVYKDFYYFNLSVGPTIYFDDKSEPKRYFFISLDNKNLLDIDYSNWMGIKEVVSDCIYYTANKQKRNGNYEVSIFIYLMRPPKFSFQYSLLKKKKVSDANFTKVSAIEGENFSRFSLPLLPDNEIYVLGLQIHDSILNKESIVYKDVYY